MASTIPVFAGIKKFWEAGNSPVLATFTGIFNEDPPAQTARPYLVMRPISEAPSYFSNTSQGDAGSFRAEIVADNVDDSEDSQGQVRPGAGQGLLALVEAALKNKSIPLDGGRTLQKFRPGPITYEVADHIWTVGQEWQFTVAMPK